ncbi:protein kinase [Micromonospora sp. NPDC049559]|uniref:serine/threonine-protein kinase n=1 Tax=Micromonospora sp. NPDC049559 TaxID=3155923 RepID=UPI00344AE4F0
MTQIPTWSGGPVNTPSGRAAPGSTIGGRYELRAAVGHGGMGTVWRAADTLLRRDVAVKEVVLPPGLAPSDRDALYERTLREARAAAALQHPAVVQVYDVVTEGGRPWIVMELLDARSLADIVIEDGPLAPRAVAKIGIALLGALEVAHAIGVLHRDVKPANVLICNDGRCVLTDFGVARMPTDVQLTTPGMVLGSPHFISPERAMGQDFGPPSDLFSLGVTLYTAVEGRPPFDKGDPIETMHSVVEDPPAPPVKSGPLTRVLMGLLEKDPARRLDVNASRSMLRDLLGGVLASKAPTDQMTDPYAVVPAQRAPWQPPVAPPQPSGQIGGRAMLAPGESLTDRLAELRRGEQDGAAAATAGQNAAALEATGAQGPVADVTAPIPPGAPAGHPTAPGSPTGATGPAGTTPNGLTGLSAPTGAMSAPTGAMPAQPGTRPAGAGPASYGETTTALPPMAARSGGPGPGGDATTAMPSWPHQQPPPGHGYGIPAAAPGAPGGGGAPTGARQTGGNLLGTIKGWPRKVQLAAAGGVALVLVLGTVLLFSGGDPERPAPQAGSLTPSAPAVQTQPYADRGVAVNVPKGWTRNGAGTYVDYVDPQDSGRKVRIIVEKFSGSSSHRWAEIAENGLKKPDSKSCARPYARLAFTDVELAGKAAAEFEYNCGQGDAMRHGVWRGVVSGGKAYSFYLTSNDGKFAESKPIFDEMVRSFQLTDAG